MWESRNLAGGHAVLRSAAWRREINGPGCRPSRHLASTGPGCWLSRRAATRPAWMPAAAFLRSSSLFNAVADARCSSKAVVLRMAGRRELEKGVKACLNGARDGIDNPSRVPFTQALTGFCFSPVGFGRRTRKTGPVELPGCAPSAQLLPAYPPRGAEQWSAPWRC
jgi:hypothetical protein